jgi:tetratricopeptide (TPR) repeat protein
MARALVLALGLAQTAGAEWIRVATPEFEVLTDAGEKKGRAAISRLEEIRSVFGLAAPAPKVFLFASEADRKMFDLHEFRPGAFFGTPERNYILLRDATEHIVYHEYTHFVLARTHGPLPAWFAEGAAEYYSALGRPIPLHLARLQKEGWQPLETWLAGTGDSARFYAQSWAFVHMLYRSRTYREKLPRFLDLIEQRTPAPQAFAQAFGKPIAQALDEARATAGTQSAPIVLKPDRTAARVTPLDRAEAAIALADLSLDMNQYANALEIYTRLERERPDDPAAATGLGALALRRGDYDDARRLLRRAIALGSREARTHYEYAMLVRESKGPRREVIESLRKAVELAPDFADARELLERAETGRGEPEQAARSAPKPAVHVPESWSNPRGDTRIEGVLERVDCLGAQARLRIRAEGKPYSLLVREPRKIPVGSAHGVTFEFACGPQKPRKVAVEYVARVDAALATAGDVTSIDLP